MKKQEQKEKLKFDTPKDILSSQNIIKCASIQNIRKTIQKDPKMAYSLIIAYLFKSYKTFQKLEEEWELMPKGLCGKIITTEHQVYKCINCGIKSDYHIFCKQCFQQGFFEGKHKGHRYKAKSDGSGCCDCGDISGLKQEGFCSKHEGITVCKAKLDQQLSKRLRIVLFDIFNILFETTEQVASTTSMNPETLLISNQSTRNTKQAQLSLKYIFQTLLQLIGQFSKNKLPLQFAISRILLQPINQQRIHLCQSQCPIFFIMTRKKHMCKQSIASLFLRYSYIFLRLNHQIQGILYSLFTDQIFKETLSHIYLKDFKFMCICFDYLKADEAPLVKVTKINQMYFQFFGQKYANILIKSPYFTNIVQRLKQTYTFMNGKFYKAIYNNVEDLNNVLNGLVNLCQQFKIESLCLKLIEYIISISYSTNVSKAVSYDHHKHKIYLITGLLHYVQILCSCIQYKEENMKQSQFKLIQKFFNDQLNIQEQKNQEQKFEPQITIEWQCLPELLIGNIIFIFYSRFGKQQTRKLICNNQSGNKVKQYIRKILKAQTEAYKLSRSKQVGFPNQILPKDLYKQLYKQPSQFIFDSLIALLQVLALVVPEYFIQQLSLLKLNNIIEFLTDIVLEQSCFINAGANCNIKSDLMKNALEIEVINFINMKNNRTFKQLKEAYFSKMFAQQVETKFALKQVAEFDQRSETFSIKQQYKNLTQAILIQRLDKDFGQFFEEQSSPELKLLKKDNLFKYQKENQKQTICSLLTEQMTKSKHFEEIFNFCFADIWKQKQGIQNYEHVKLISTIYLRSSNRKSMQNTIQKYLNQPNKTNIQKLIFEVINTMNQSQQIKIIELKKVQNNKKVNRMKAHMEKMKKQQQKFLINNQDLINEFQQNTQQKIIKQLQSYQTCLICHQQQDKGQYPGFILLIQNVIIQQKYVTQYLSCGHTFHRSCLNMQTLCPLCKHPFNNMFTYNSTIKINFLDSKNLNTLLNQQLDIKGLFTSSLSLNEIIEIINHKVYFSIFDTCTRFIEKNYRHLRSLYYHFVSQKQSKIFVGQINQKCKDLLSFDLNPTQKKIMYLGLMQTLLLIPLFKNSLETKKLFEQLISNVFTRFLACNFLCFVNHSEISDDNIHTLFKQHQEVLLSQMNEFCQGIIFIYMILFDDNRNSVISSFTNQDVVKGKILTNYPQLFVFDKEIFSNYVKKDKLSTLFVDKSYQSLISIPNTITMQNNYMEFHDQYKNLICDQCEKIANVFKNRSWMCLLCGYKSCSIKCPKSPQSPIFSLIFDHLDTQHNSSGIIIDLNTSLICIAYQRIFFEYGHIYSNQFGQYNSDEIKDWQSLKLQTLKWNKLIQQLQKRTLPVYLIQNKLKKYFAAK